jgi:hypothetical protein
VKWWWLFVGAMLLIFGAFFVIFLITTQLKKSVLLPLETNQISSHFIARSAPIFHSGPYYLTSSQNNFLYDPPPPYSVT